MSKPVMFVALALTLSCGSTDAMAQDKFFNSSGVRIRYVDQGVGEPVVLVHGQGGSLDSWRDAGTIDALSKHYRVIALDQRGFGKSDKPHEPSEYGSHMGDDIVRLLDHLDITRAHVVGYSMGARVTSWLIVDRPQRLITATLGGSTYYVDTPERRRMLEEQAKTQLTGLTVEGVKQRNPGWTDDQAAAFIAKIESRKNDSLATAANYRGTPGLFISEKALSATKVPVLHVVGSLESNMAESRHLKDTVLPAAELVIVPGATHNEAMQRQEFVEAIEKFLTRHVSVRPSAEVDPAAARIASPILERLDRAWTAGDGGRFSAEFTDDADVINVSGDHFHTRAAIAKQIQAIFSTVFKGSTHRSRTLELARYLADGIIIVVSSSVIDVPAGPLAPLATSRQTFIIRERAGVWQIRHWHNTPIRAR